VLPKTATSAEGVNKKWEKLARAPGELRTRKAILSWPVEKKLEGKVKGNSNRKPGTGGTKGNAYFFQVVKRKRHNTERGKGGTRTRTQIGEGKEIARGKRNLPY
jgi:hypothetical protein